MFLNTSSSSACMQMDGAAVGTCSACMQRCLFHSAHCVVSSAPLLIDGLIRAGLMCNNIYRQNTSRLDRAMHGHSPPTALEYIP